MDNWVGGNVPKKKDACYWLTVNAGEKNITHDLPSKYLEENGSWIDFDGKQINVDSVIAYSEIVKPKPSTTIGNGYYIKAVRDGEEGIYSLGLQSVKWSNIGYTTEQKAISAAKRMKKLDAEDGFQNCMYEIIDGEGNSLRHI